ncbi:MAG: GDSL-type esterase/lipase family protein [Acholeplasmatales bacterium]|jgi:hypothetical protein|nr:GDSL-type esterase/lipase family protein [Acholeplasmatales bacterium]
MKKMFQMLLVILLVLFVASCQLTENDPVFDRIELAQNPTKTNYIEGESFDPSGLVINGISKDAKGAEIVENVTSKVTYDKTLLSYSDTKVVATYTHLEFPYTVEIAIIVSPIRELAGNNPVLSLPSTGINIDTNSTKGVANSVWNLTYSESAINISVLVKDLSLSTPANIFNGDAIEVSLSKVTRETGIVDGTLFIAVGASSNQIIKKYQNNNPVDYTSSNIVIEFTKFTIDGVYVDGYKVDISVKLEELGLSDSSKEVLVYPGLYNGTGTTANVNFYDGYDTNANETHTYPLLTDDNVLVKNPWHQIGFVFGDVFNLVHKAGWDLSHDDGSENSYAQIVTLNQDNNLYMYKETGTDLLAEISFNALSIHNDEKYGKFGIAVTDATGLNGFLFFVDAAGNGTNMTGRSISVVNRVAGDWVWSTISVLHNLSSADLYQGENYLSLKIYREKDIFKFYVNDIEVGIKGPFTGITKESDCVVQINSFNIKLKVKDYYITSDAAILEDYKIVSEDIDYLFIGDSYIDTAFWTSYANSFASNLEFSSANMGVGGTNTPYWISSVPTLSTIFNPRNIVIHIGVNDINDNLLSGEATLSLVTQLINSLQERYIDAKIYFITIEPNNFRVENYSKYQVVNDGVRSISSVTLIDTAAALGGIPGNPVKQFFGIDGLHLNADGYAIFEKTIYEALDIERPSNLSSHLGDYGLYAYSSGWKFGDEYVENIGAKEQQIYFDGIRDTNFAASVDIYVGQNTAQDNFPKVGLAVKGSSKTLYFFIDVNVPRDNNWGNYVIRESGGDWIWAETDIRPYVNLRNVSYNNNYKTLEIIKVGTSLYFISDSKVVQYAENIFALDEELQVSVLTFNLNIRLKNATIYQGDDYREELKNYKIAEKTGSLIDGDISDWTASSKSNPVVIPAFNGKEVLVYAYMAVEGIYIAYDALHGIYINNAPAWFNNTNIEFQLQAAGTRASGASGWYSRWEEGGSRDIGVAKFKTTSQDLLYRTIAEVFVPWSMIDGFSYNNDYVKAGFAWKTPGDINALWSDTDFWFVAEADPGFRTKLITKNGFAVATVLTIDGDNSDWDETLLANEVVIVNADRNFKIQAYLAEDGIYGYFKVTTPTPLNINSTVNGWWLNPNFEFWVYNQDPSVKLVVAGGKLSASGFVTESQFTYDDATNTLLIEYFISFANYSGSHSEALFRCASASIQGGFGWLIDPNKVVTSNGIQI